MCCWEAPEFSLLLDVASPFDFLLRKKKLVVMFPGVNCFQYSYLTDILHGQYVQCSVSEVYAAASKCQKH